MLSSLDLFSGIGGFARGLHTVCTPAAYCEISPECQSLLRSLMRRGLIGTAPIFDDVTRLTRADLPKGRKPAVITAGFPCQDVCTSNPHGQGVDGPRSGLVWQIFRLIDELPSVKVVILENSSNIRNRGMDRVLAAFEKRAFDVQWDIFSAAQVGAPMLRKRWFCVAWRRGASTTIRRLASLARVRFVVDQNHWLRGEPVPRLIAKAHCREDRALSRAAMLGN